MTQTFNPDFQRSGISFAGDASAVFSHAALIGANIQAPTNWCVLADYRPASTIAEALNKDGQAPVTSGGWRFDPQAGPFTHKVASEDGWAQSLEFLRDIQVLRSGTNPLAIPWLIAWLDVERYHRSQTQGRLNASKTTSTKTQRLIWRSRRVQNSLTYVLPIVHSLPASSQATFWGVLIDDIGKLAVPTQGLWAHLTSGFDPMSPRAQWYRATGILAVEASLPGLLRADVMKAALDDVDGFIQSDGMFLGGSVMATLSAGADLLTLSGLVPIDPTLARVRSALGALRRADGSLVTFGEGSPRHNVLLKAILGSTPPRSSAHLLKSGIVHVRADRTEVWLHSPQPRRDYCAPIEIDFDGLPIITNTAAYKSALITAQPVVVKSSGCKRRDEEGHILISTNAVLSAAGHTYSCLRQLQISKDGRRLEGEDIVSPNAPDSPQIFERIEFIFSSGCELCMSKDNQSLLIVTSQQQAWRFRVQGMDFGIEMGSVASGEFETVEIGQMLVCRWSAKTGKTHYRSVWQLYAED